MERAVLVTGGGGFIGSHACKALKSSGFLPVTLDNLSTGHADAVKFGPLVRGDVRDAALVARTLADHDCCATIHLYPSGEGRGGISRDCRAPWRSSREGFQRRMG